MAKYSKVYLRNKKESNISLPLRYSFLTSIFVDQMSVKNAALKWKIHYSSAKIIARTAKRSNLQSIFQKNEKPTLLCSWKELSQEKSSSSPASSEREIMGSDSTDSLGSQEVEPVLPNKIEVVSTIGWNFLKGMGPEGEC